MAVPKNAGKTSEEMTVVEPEAAITMGGDTSKPDEKGAEKPAEPKPESREAGVPDKSPAADPQDPVELEAWFASVPEDARSGVIAYVKGLRAELDGEKSRAGDLESRANGYYDTLLSDKPDYSALLDERTAELRASIEAAQEELAALRGKPDIGPELEVTKRALEAAIEELSGFETARDQWEAEKSRYEADLGDAKKSLGDYDNGFEELVRFALHGYHPSLATDDSAPEEFVRELIDAARSFTGEVDVPTKMGSYGGAAKRLAERRGLKPSLPMQFVLAAPTVPDPADRSGTDAEKAYGSNPAEAAGYKRLFESLRKKGVG